MRTDRIFVVMMRVSQDSRLLGESKSRAKISTLVNVRIEKAPPTGLIKADHYDVKINFELNTEQGASK